MMRNYYLILIPILIGCSIQAKTIYVGKQGNYTRIKSALQNINNGDTIIVSKGLYKEGNIIINKSICFLGKDFPVIDGDKKYEVLSIKASHVVIKGFKIQHSSYASLDDPGGIKIYESRNVTIEEN
jgi:nitrous oxidase accessory protein